MSGERERDNGWMEMHMEYSPTETIFWAIKQTLNLKEQKSYSVFSQTTMKIK